MNVKMAMRKAKKLGIEVKTVVVYNRVEEILTEKGIKVYRSYVGNYFTSLEMMGVTLTVMKLDDELKECIDMPANSVGLKQF